MPMKEMNWELVKRRTRVIPGEHTMEMLQNLAVNDEDEALIENLRRLQGDAEETISIWLPTGNITPKEGRSEERIIQEFTNANRKNVYLAEIWADIQSIEAKSKAKGITINVTTEKAAQIIRSTPIQLFGKKFFVPNIARIQKKVQNYCGEEKKIYEDAYYITIFGIEHRKAHWEVVKELRKQGLPAVFATYSNHFNTENGQHAIAQKKRIVFFETSEIPSSLKKLDREQQLPTKVKIEGREYIYQHKDQYLRGRTSEKKSFRAKRTETKTRGKQGGQKNNTWGKETQKQVTKTWRPKRTEEEKEGRKRCEPEKESDPEGKKGNGAEEEKGEAQENEDMDIDKTEKKHELPAWVKVITKEQAEEESKKRDEEERNKPEVPNSTLRWAILNREEEEKIKQKEEKKLTKEYQKRMKMAKKEKEEERRKERMKQMYEGIRMSIKEIREKRFERRLQRKEKKDEKKREKQSQEEVQKPPDINGSY